LRNFKIFFDSFNIWSIVITSLIAIPPFVVFGFIFLDSEVWNHLKETVLSDYIINSLLLVFGVATLSAIFGVLSAWFTTMYEFRGRKTLEWMLVLPLAIPPFIVGYTYAGILDYSGIVQSTIREVFEFSSKRDYYFPDIMSLGGAILVISFVLYPYVYLIVKASFINNSSKLIEVGQTFGLNLTKSFFKIALPLARVAIVGSVSLVVMEAFNNYGTVHYYGVDTFSTGIFRVWFGMGDSISAGKLASILMIFIFLMLFLERLSRAKLKFTTKHEHFQSKRYRPSSKLSGFFIFLVCALPVFFGFIAPMLQLIFWSLDSLYVLFTTEYLELITNTFSIAFVASFIGVFLAFFIAFNGYRSSHWISSIVTRVATLGYAVPGAVIAVGVMLPFAFVDNSFDSFMREYFNISTGLLLSGTFFALIFGYIVRFLPVAFNSIDAGFSKLSKNLYEVSTSLGYSKFKTLYKIYLPLLKPSLLTAMILIFIDILKELPATLILRPFNFDTLATRAYELASNEMMPESAIYSLSIIIMGLIPVLFLVKNMAKR